MRDLQQGQYHGSTVSMDHFNHSPQGNLARAPGYHHGTGDPNVPFGDLRFLEREAAIPAGNF